MALPLHVLAVALVNSTWMASQFILPIIARREFKANDFETVLITASPTIFFSFSIFWNDVFKRTSFGKYLWMYWLVACLPMVAVAGATEYWMILVPHLVACIGGAGYHPAAGDLLNHLYPAATRGRWYSIIAASSMATGAIAAFFIGESMDIDNQAFRIFLPLIVGMQGLGLLVMAWLSHRSGHSERRVLAANDSRSLWTRVVEPITHTKEVLREDPVFAKYEASYMVYGVGWMICYALLPMLIDHLKLPYGEATRSTQFAYLIALCLAYWPAGLLMDKLGAIRSTGLSFLMLSLYPIGMFFATGAVDLTFVSAWYGLAHAGASVGWILGPVALAPNKEKVAQYVAIHSTMVGIRGKIFQGLGVFLYWLSGSFGLPLALAAIGFLYSSYLMFKLHSSVQSRLAAKVSASTQ